MAYQVLARKWRPKNFSEVVGQDYVVQVLTNTLNTARIHQVYLFSGTRGVGKTTLARIFAKSLNCAVSVSSNPCGLCRFCLEIDQGQFIDFYEIDAASRTKVEDTRELMESVAYPPLQGRYKVYLIDEIHMFSGHSFNALLKTLEEPPEQVVFILATTEPKKLPITILSRCVQLYLRQITPKQLIMHLQQVCAQENVQYEDLALMQIAKAADGSVRDALSILDQAIVLCCNNLTSSAVDDMLGYVSHAIVVDILRHLLERNGKKLFNVLAKLHSYAPNYQQILAELLAILHKIAVKQIVRDYEISEDLADLAKISSPEVIQLYYQIALRGQQDLCYSPAPWQGFEMLILRLLAFEPIEPKSPQLIKQEQKFVGKLQNDKVKSDMPIIFAEENNSPLEKKEQSLRVNWHDFVAKSHLTGLTKSLASHCSVSSLTQDTIVLTLAEEYQGMINPQVVDKLEQAIEKYYSKSLHLKLVLSKNSVNDSPANCAVAEQNLQNKLHVKNLENDPNFIKIRDVFNATVSLPTAD